jgi:hypothetical protein
MISLRDEQSREALRLLLLRLADFVDEGSASYAQLMVKVRLRPSDAKTVSHLVTLTSRR